MKKEGITKVVVGVVILLAIIAGGWWLLGKGNTDSGDTFKIGVILPLTGDTANLGEPMRNVMQIAVDEINQKGGIDGKLIELVVEDGKCDGAGSSSAMQKLATIDKVAVVIGGTCSSESLAAEPIATKAKIALFSAASSNPKLTGISPFFARNYPSDSFQGTMLADMVYEKGITNVALIVEQTDYSFGIAETFERRFTKLGGTTVREEYQTNATDFRSSLAKLQATKSGALFIVAGSSTSGDRIFKQLGELSWKPQILLSDIVVGDSATLAKYPALLEGALGAEFGTDTTNPKFVAMLNAYVAKHGAAPEFQAYVQTAYDSVYLVADAIRVGGYDGTKIAKQLHSTKDWPGASGRLTIGPDGDPTVGHRPEVVRNGKVEPYTK